MTRPPPLSNYSLYLWSTLNAGTAKEGKSLLQLFASDFSSPKSGEVEGGFEEEGAEGREDGGR